MIVSIGYARVSREVRVWCVGFVFQAEDGIRDLVRSRGLGDVYKRQPLEISVGTNVVQTGAGVPLSLIGMLVFSAMACSLSLIHI